MIRVNGLSADHTGLVMAYWIPGHRATDDVSLDDAVRTVCTQICFYLTEVMLDPVSYPTFPSAPYTRVATVLP